MEGDERSIVPQSFHFDYYEAIEGEHFEPKGKTITIKNAHTKRGYTVLKTDTTTLQIPELDITEPEGTGKFCSLAELISSLHHNLERAFELMSSPKSDQVLDTLRDYAAGTEAFTLILDDPLGNVAVVNTDSDTDITVHTYPRTRRQQKEYDMAPEWRVYKDEEGIEALKKVLRTCNKICCLTGAGVSTESGIAAWRGPVKVEGKNQIWDELDPDNHTITCIRSERDRIPKLWAGSEKLWKALDGCDPNHSHELFAQLHKQNRLEAVITQNIDGLYQMAGIPNEYIVELHGNEHHAKCDSECGAENLPMSEAISIYHKADDGIPLCECGAFLRPNTILFNESLDTEVLERARQHLENADALLVMGTSLLVYPANELPWKCLDRGVPVALINKGETSFDDVVDFHITHTTCSEASKDILDWV